MISNISSTVYRLTYHLVLNAALPCGNVMMLIALQNNTTRLHDVHKRLCANGKVTVRWPLER